jgi:hypothetical protein
MQLPVSEASSSTLDRAGAAQTTVYSTCDDSWLAPVIRDRDP